MTSEDKHENFEIESGNKATDSLRGITEEIATETERAKYKLLQALVLGIFQIAFAVAAVIINAVGLVLQTNSRIQRDHEVSDEHGFVAWYRFDRTVAYFVGAGFWCSFFFFLSAALGIYATKKVSRGLLSQLSNLFFLSTLFALVMLGISSWALARDVIRLNDDLNVNLRDPEDYTNPVHKGYATEAQPFTKQMITLSGSFVAVSLFEVLISLSMACLGLRIGRKRDDTCCVCPKNCDECCDNCEICWLQCTQRKSSR